MAVEDLNYFGISAPVKDAEEAGCFRWLLGIDIRVSYLVKFLEDLIAINAIFSLRVQHYDIIRPRVFQNKFAINAD